MEKHQKLHVLPEMYGAENYNIMDAVRSNSNDIGLLLLRITIGGLMLVHGINKIIYGTGQIEQILTSAGLPNALSIGVLLGEVVGPLLLITGFKTRLGAALIAINMFVAVVLVHASQVGQLTPAGGWMLELNALYLLGSLAILFLGAGRFAISKEKVPPTK